MNAGALTVSIRADRRVAKTPKRGSYVPAMTTYVYETIPQIPGVEPVRFEVRQSMADAPLKTHPQTGEPVRRVITGGFGFVAQRASAGTPAACGPQCACCRRN